MSDPLDKLRVQLELQEWPNVYLFKFIAPNNSETVAIITAMFDDGTDLTYNKSKTGKYVSISAKELMIDVDSIIAKYRKVSEIKGVIAL